MAAQTHISASTKVRGSISGSEDLSVEGYVEGNVRIDGDFTLGENGRVEGDVSARRVIVNGTVKGNITTTVHLLLAKTAKVKGDLSGPVLKLEEGALLYGDVSIGGGDQAKVVGSSKSKAKSKADSKEPDIDLPEGVVARKVKVSEA
jgi:cytoskeletal protein CcmA (bactofilin family)